MERLGNLLTKVNVKFYGEFMALFNNVVKNSKRRLKKSDHPALKEYYSNKEQMDVFHAKAISTKSGVGSNDTWVNLFRGYKAFLCLEWALKIGSMVLGLVVIVNILFYDFTIPLEKVYWAISLIVLSKVVSLLTDALAQRDMQKYLEETYIEYKESLKS